MILRLLVFAFFLTAMNVFSQTAPPIETGVSQTLAKWRAANYSDVRYKLNLTLEKMSPTLNGNIEIRVNLTDEGAKNDLILDWRTTQSASNKDNSYADVWAVNQVIFDVVGTGGKTTNEHLLISKRYLKIGENTIKITFKSPIKTSGGAITRYVDKEDGAEYVYSLFVPSDASTAFPVFDQPDLKARFRLKVNLPQNWRAITNTKIKTASSSIIDKVFPDGTATKIEDIFEFEVTQPISTYVFAFAAGEFKEFIEDSNLPVDETPKEFWTEEKLKEHNNHERSRIYVRKSQVEKFKVHRAETFRLNREAVKYLESYFDYKFPFPKYDLVLIPEFPFGGMEHAGATFLREDRVIFPTEPTKNDFVTRANLIFHEAAHQWFGDTVTMRWFDDLWLKEGFAEFMAYKTLEKVMPEYNSWKIFYERNKQAAYLTDSTKGTTPIYQEIPNLSAAKSAYGNIVYRKAPSFLRQAEFYLGADKFQTAVRAFLKKHQFANAEWTDLVKEFELASGQDLKDWANVWVKQAGLGKLSVYAQKEINTVPDPYYYYSLRQEIPLNDIKKSQQPFQYWKQKVKILVINEDDTRGTFDFDFSGNLINPVDMIVSSDISNPDGSIRLGRLISVDNVFGKPIDPTNAAGKKGSLLNELRREFIFPNYQDYGYGIFLLDEKSRDYVQKNIQNEPDDFLRTMMWGSLWDSVREAELAPQDYVALVIKNISDEPDESTIQTLLGRVSTAMNYYLSDAQRNEFAPKIEAVLIDKMQNAPTLGQRITFYRAFLNAASSEKARQTLRGLLSGKFIIKGFEMNKPKDVTDIITRLFVLNDADAQKILLDYKAGSALSQEAQRYSYAAFAASAETEIKQKYFNEFLNDREIPESYFETAIAPFNSIKQADLTLPYLEKALTELPNLKRTRKIFFVNGWLAAFVGGQKSEEALAIVNKFMADNPTLDKDLRLKILENSDNLERAVKIRRQFSK